MLSWVFPYLSVFICFDLLSAVPQASDFDAKLYQISENTQQICNKFAPKTSNIRKSKNKKEISVIRYISVILLHFCFFLLDLLSFVFAYMLLAFSLNPALSAISTILPCNQHLFTLQSAPDCKVIGTLLRDTGEYPVGKRPANVGKPRVLCAKIIRKYLQVSDIFTTFAR